jgi:hypothetical protein
MKLLVESDGDRYPKDIYLVDDEGTRVATMEGHNEQTMFKTARAISHSVNLHDELLQAARLALATLIVWGGKCEAQGEKILDAHAVLESERMRSLISKAQK